MSIANSVLKAIGDKKYTVAINSQVNIQNFEIIRPCMGLLMRVKEIDPLYLKVGFEDKSFKHTPLVSEIKLTDYLCIAQRLDSRVIVHQVDVKAPTEGNPNATEEWYQFILPFSFNGDLDLNRDNKLIVQMSQKENVEERIDAYFEYYAVGRSGYPILVDREKILQSEDNITLGFQGFDYCYFPQDVDFDFVQYEQQGFSGGSRQTTKEQAIYDAAVFDKKNDIDLANGGLLFDTRQRQELTINHSNDDDITIFKIDCERNVLRSASFSTVSNVGASNTPGPKPTFSTVGAIGNVKPSFSTVSNAETMKIAAQSLKHR